jgi:hypothetical protein
MVFWDMTLCNDVAIYQRSEGSRCLHLHFSLNTGGSKAFSTVNIKHIDTLPYNAEDHDLNVYLPENSRNVSYFIRYIVLQKCEVNIFEHMHFM